KQSSFSSARAPSSQYGAPSTQYGAPTNQGVTTEDPLAEPANYEFKYDVTDAISGSDFGAKEGRDGETTWGEYRVQLPDGRTQIVKYEADQNGYRPEIEYQDPPNGFNGNSAAGNDAPYPPSRRQGGY
ncbi:Hypothetical predicted protein, partial [Cloeon dipterum]